MKVLFIPFALESHIRSVFGLSHLLKKNNYDVFISSPKNFFGIIENVNLKPILLGGFPFGFGFERENRQKFENSKNVYSDELLDRIQNRIYFDRETKLQNIFNEIQPDIIFLDVFCSTDILIILNSKFRTQFKMLFFQGSFLNVDSSIYPAVDSSLLPIERKRLFLDYYFNQVRFQVSNFIDFIKYLSFSDYGIIKRNNSINKNKISFKKNRVHRIQMNEMNYLLLCYEEFEFEKSFKSKNYFYVGNCNNFLKPKQHNLFWNNYLSFLQIQKSFKKKTIIYISFGTVVINNIYLQQDLISFIKKIIFINSIDKNFILIFSIGNLSKYFFSNKDIYFFNDVPQIEILNVANVFITHGGSGSIIEATMKNVPMLASNFNSVYDHSGNISKMVYHGLGIYVNYKLDSSEIILKKINELLNNPIYINNLKKMTEIISKNENYLEKKILNIIENTNKFT